MAEVNERVRSEAEAIVRITNDDLVCKNCVCRYDDGTIFGNTSKCEKYPVKKPIQILLGGKCDEYVKQ